MTQVPYHDVLAGADPLHALEHTSARLTKALARFTPAQIAARPAPGKWSLREVTAHLADCEIAWSWRLRHVYECDNPTLAPFDQDTWARAYDRYSFPAALAAFTALREWNVAFISGLTPAEKRRPYTHPERGPETLWTIVEIMAGHDLHHLARLEA